jgi:hypothetical protein
LLFFVLYIKLQALNAFNALNEETPLSKLILVLAGSKVDGAPSALVDGLLHRIAGSLVKHRAMARICS